MNKQVPNKVRKTVGIMMLTGVMAVGAYALLRTGAVATQSQLIATTALDGTDGNGGSGNNGPDNNTGIIGLLLNNEQNKINKINAIPETAAEGAKNPYTFDIVSTGTQKQVVRLNIQGMGVGKGADGQPIPGSVEFDKALVKVKLVNTTDGNKVVFEGTLAELEAAQTASGFGDVFELEGKATKSFSLAMWIDESTTKEQLYGPNGEKEQSVEFKVGAQGVQHKGVFEGVTPGADMNAKFEEHIKDIQAK